MKLSCIYKIENTLNGAVYIGSAANYVSRVSNHRQRLKSNTHHSIKLQHAWNKYGESSFVFSVLEVVENREALIPAEQRWMDLLAPAYNIAKVAGSPLGVKHGDEMKRKISIAMTGRVYSEETLAKMRAACVGRVPVCTPEIIEKRAAKLRGRKRPAAAVEATAAARRGKKMSDEARANMSAAHLGKKLGPMPMAQRAKISAALKGRKATEENRARLAGYSKARGAPVLTAEERKRGDDKRRGVKRTPEQIARIVAGQIAARAARQAA
jgi:group I intron endonuclease